ncbi:hypothetical protein [Empedobacter sedimenti]|uniref:hypothetical protein n=1 Tax=Empedobacter sedimenti TaxID=3042610 RepID=UPI0024A74607|nr:hypothetical protein [Empedobacter sedimenti]
MKKSNFSLARKLYYKSLENEIYLDKLISDQLKFDDSNKYELIRPQKSVEYLKRFGKRFLYFYKFLFLFWEFFNFLYQTRCLISVIFKKNSRIIKEDDIILDLTPMLLPRLKNVKVNLPNTYISLQKNKSAFVEKSYTIYDFLNFKDIIKIYFYSIYLPFNYRNRIKKQEHILQTYTSFEWLCVWFTLKKINPNKIWYGNHCDRWAVLIDNINENNILIQHGIEDGSLNPPVKISNVKKAFLFNTDQKFYFDKFILDCDYELNILPTSIDLIDLTETNKFSILMIGNYAIYGDLEKEIIEKLNTLEVDIYLKPHPNQPIDYYDNMSMNLKFNLIKDKNFFPKVNLVLGYNSTLALEYSLAGVDVLFYENDKEVFYKKLFQKFYEN